MVRVARPTSSGCPALPRTTGTTAASQHNRRSAAGVNAPPRSSTAPRARCSRSSRVTVTVSVGRCPPVCGRSPWVSTYPHTSPRASARRCAVDRGSSLLRGAVLASISVVIAAPQRRVAEPTRDRAPAVARRGQEQLVDRRWVVPRLRAVLVQRRDQLGCELVQFGGRMPSGVLRQDLLGAGPHLGGEPLGRLAAEDLRDDLDVPQPDQTVDEHRRGGGQPRRQHRAVQTDPRAHLLGGDNPPVGFESVPPDEVHERPDRRAVAALGEDAAALQRRHRSRRRAGPAAAPPLRPPEAARPARRRPPTRPRQPAPPPPARGGRRLRGRSRSRAESPTHHRQNQGLEPGQRLDMRCAGRPHGCSRTVDGRLAGER